MEHGPSVAVFVLQIVALLIGGRLMGEIMQRIGQPAVMGQIVCGILLGPSVFGVLSPHGWSSVFPDDPGQKAMLDAVAQLGILLLLLVTGMETDLSIFKDARRPAVSISLGGIVVPFACGAVLAELLPATMLPDPARRLITTLFLGTALSISSVKIVALIVRDLGFVRRTVGQVILAAAILDDTIGWIIMSITFGLALHGEVHIGDVARSVLGTALFLVLSFTVGRRWVFRLIRWSNDNFVSEMPAISMILAIAGSLALLTNAIGVHLVLGAFVAGILIGQSPILTRQIQSQLRGLIVALFMPVFFGLAGMTMDLRALAQPQFAMLTVALIILASAGKFSGAFLGGRVGGLSYGESLAVGCGMNARGSTEIIIASIGLSIGALNKGFFTAIVAMAVVTSMAMPPMLRWALKRLPMAPEEHARLEREEFEARGFLKHVERLLLAVDASPSGQLASTLVGLLAGVRHIPTTVLHLNDAQDEPRGLTKNHEERATAAVKAAAETGDEAAVTEADKVDITTRTHKSDTSEEAIATEARKGYGLLIIGREPASVGNTFDAQITRSAIGFSGSFAVAIARGVHRVGRTESPLNILVPVTGTRISRQGAEVAIALAQASSGTVTAIHIARPTRDRLPWSRRFGTVLAPESAAIREIVKLGEHYGIDVRGSVRNVRGTQNAILQQIATGHHDLLVMGVSPRPADQLFFGDVPAEVLEKAECSVLFVSSEAVSGTEASGATEQS